MLGWLFKRPYRDAELHAKLDKLAKFITNRFSDLEDLIMSTQAELAAELRAVTEQNEKARAEIIDKIADLEEALANAGSTTVEVDEAMAALKASVQKDDDLHPDAPVEP